MIRSRPQLSTWLQWYTTWPHYRITNKHNEQIKKKRVKGTCITYCRFGFPRSNMWKCHTEIHRRMPLKFTEADVQTASTLHVIPFYLYLYIYYSIYNVASGCGTPHCSTVNTWSHRWTLHPTSFTTRSDSTHAHIHVPIYLHTYSLCVATPTIWCLMWSAIVWWNPSN